MLTILRSRAFSVRAALIFFLIAVSMPWLSRAIIWAVESVAGVQMAYSAMGIVEPMTGALTVGAACLAMWEATRAVGLRD